MINEFLVSKNGPKKGPFLLLLDGFTKNLFAVVMTQEWERGNKYLLKGQVPGLHQYHGFFRHKRVVLAHVGAT